MNQVHGTQYVLLPVDEPGAWYPVGVELVGRDGWEENLLGLSHKACKTNIDFLLFPDYSLLNSAKMHTIFPTLGYVLKGWKRASLNYFNYISMSIKWIHTRVFNLINPDSKIFLKIIQLLFILSNYHLNHYSKTSPYNNLNQF